MDLNRGTSKELRRKTW